MNIEELREFCLSLKGTTEGFPFNDTTLVFKVLGKIFCMTDTEDNFSINIKNNPEKIIQLREQYPAVLPGYHMNKKHWNTIIIDGSIASELLKTWITDSYTLIVKNLPKNKKQELNDLI